MSMAVKCNLMPNDAAADVCPAQVPRNSCEVESVPINSSPRGNFKLNKDFAGSTSKMIGSFVCEAVCGALRKTYCRVNQRG